MAYRSTFMLLCFVDKPDVEEELMTRSRRMKVSVGTHLQAG